MFCENCGYKNEKGLFCENCGYRLENEQLNNSQDINTGIISKQNIEQEKNKDVQKSEFNKNLKEIKNKKKSKLPIIIILLLLVVTIVILYFTIFKKNNIFDNNDNSPILEDELMIDMVVRNNGVPRFIDGKFTELLVSDETSALNALDDIKDIMQIKDVNSEFIIENVSKNQDITFYKLQQQYNGLNVYGMQLIISVDKDGNVSSLTEEYIPNIECDINNILSVDQIKTKILGLYGNNAQISDLEKMVYADNQNYKVIYNAVISTNEDILSLIIDAKTGEIITKSSLIQNVKYEYTDEGSDGKTHTINIYESNSLTDPMVDRILGYTHSFYDENRNIIIVDGRGWNQISTAFINKFFNQNFPIQGKIDNNKFIYSTQKATSDSQTLKEAVTTLDNFSKIYDYYKNVLGRNSYDDKGSRIVVNIGINKLDVHLDKDSLFEASLYDNASWINYANQMVIGYNSYEKDGKTYYDYFGNALDVMGHEFTHGVISHTAHFIGPLESEKNKPNETGALSEAYGDIIGSLIEDKDWIFGDTFGENALRNLSNPQDNNNPKPSKVDGDYFYPTYYLKGKTVEEFLNEKNFKTLYDWDNGGVHQNSTVVSHAAYVMYKNGAFKSKEEMAKVWYNSLFYLSSHAKFEDCAYAVLTSAKKLGLSNDSLDIIEQAFIDANILEQHFMVMEGEVTDENRKLLRNVKVEVSNNKNHYLKYITYTNDDGFYKFEKLPKGEYTVKYSKTDYKTVSNNLEIRKHLKEQNVVLEKDKADTSYCNPKKKDCIKITIYQLDTDEDGNLIEGSDSFYYPRGEKLSNYGLLSNEGIIDFGDDLSGILKSGFYYRGTKNIFDWNKPINEDIEIEFQMAGMNGQDIIDFNDKLNSWFGNVN